MSAESQSSDLDAKVKKKSKKVAAAAKTAEEPVNVSVVVNDAYCSMYMDRLTVSVCYSCNNCGYTGRHLKTVVEHVAKCTHKPTYNTDMAFDKLLASWNYVTAVKDTRQGDIYFNLSNLMHTNAPAGGVRAPSAVPPTAGGTRPPTAGGTIPPTAGGTLPPAATGAKPANTSTPSTALPLTKSLANTSVASSQSSTDVKPHLIPVSLNDVDYMASDDEDGHGDAESQNDDEMEDPDETTSPLTKRVPSKSRQRVLPPM